MKRRGAFVRRFQLNPLKTPIWAWLVVYLTPKRYHLKNLKRNMLLKEPGFNLVPRAFPLKVRGAAPIFKKKPWERGLPGLVDRTRKSGGSPA